MKWKKVESSTDISVADHLVVSSVWTRATDAYRHLGGVIDDVYGRIQSHNRR